jgi:hypothetical protein
VAVIGGSGCHPLVRTGYETFGFDDDAMLIDRAIYDHFLKPYEGQDFCDPELADLDGDRLDDSFVGSKWLVVVDYHN